MDNGNSHTLLLECILCINTLSLTTKVQDMYTIEQSISSPRYILERNAKITLRTTLLAIVKIAIYSKMNKLWYNHTIEYLTWIKK